MEITLRTTTARALVTGHHQAHREEYASQVEGWQEAMRQYGTDLVAWSNEGEDRGQRPQEPFKPLSYEESYEDLVAILDVHADDTITLTQSDIDQIVLDRFPWSNTFTSNTAMYVEEQRRIKVRHGRKR